MGDAGADLQAIGEVKFQYHTLAALALPSLAEDELAFDTAAEAAAPLAAEPAAPTLQVSFTV